MNLVMNEHKLRLHITERGEIVSVGDGIVWIKGLPNAAINEILNIQDGSKGMVFHLTEKLVGAILLEQTKELTAGTAVYHGERTLTAPVGKLLLGRIVDPLGKLLDEGDVIEYDEWGELDVLSPPIIERDFVTRPLYTGNKIVDNLIPIGKGQRQLIIGDNGLGKTSLALDTVINQKNTDVLCIYVIIGQKRSSVLNAIETLKTNGAMEYTTIVVAEATSLPGMQYLAPFSGCTIAEDWMRKGRDVLVVYDDLTSHAHTYRELSLLLRRPPGREAYPADIFYLHARLLERSTCLARKLGGGSMTSFPIIETKEGELATYIPTNLISITDGQIYFSAKLFAAGFLPAIDITKSVSRIGGKAQDEKIKKEAGRMKLDYLQFLELEAFTHFGTRLEPSLQKKIQRGQILRELLKQEQTSLLRIEVQYGLLLAFNESFFDNIPFDNIQQFTAKLKNLIDQEDLTLATDRNSWVTTISTIFPKQDNNV